MTWRGRLPVIYLNPFSYLPRHLEKSEWLYGILKLEIFRTLFENFCMMHVVKIPLLVQIKYSNLMIKQNQKAGQSLWFCPLTLLHKLYLLFLTINWCDKYLSMFIHSKLQLDDFLWVVNSAFLILLLVMMHIRKGRWLVFAWIICLYVNLGLPLAREVANVMSRRDLNPPVRFAHFLSTSSKSPPIRGDLCDFQSLKGDISGFFANAQNDKCDVNNPSVTNVTAPQTPSKSSPNRDDLWDLQSLGSETLPLC